MTIRVVLADDQGMVRSGIAMILDSEPDIEVVAQAADGLAAVDATKEMHPDVAVLDIQMPIMDGVEATRLIVGARPEDAVLPAVLALTNFNLDASLYGMLNAGAAGFLLKDAAPTDLVAAVRALADCRGWLDPEVTRTVIEQFAGRPLEVTVRDPRAAALTPREREVLVQVARGLSNAEIAEEMFLGEGTIKTHLSHILVKLGLRDRTQAVVFAYEARLVPR